MMCDFITLSSDNEDTAVDSLKEPCSSAKSVHKEQNGNRSDSEVKDASDLQGFETFLKLCADIELNKRDGCAKTMGIIEKKMLRKFEEADPDYLKSEDFKNTLICARNKVESDPSRLFVHLKEVSDELKLRNAKKKFKRKRKDNTNPGDETLVKRTKEEKELSEDSTLDDEVKINKAHVKKLDRLFHCVYIKVKKLEEKEVNWDEDEENSNYIKWCRYSKRLYLIWEKWQEAKGCLKAVKRLKSNRIAFAGTRYPELNHAIESFVNKSQKFPDFHDILKLTSETLVQEKKTREDLHRIAASAFQSLGNQLQKHRVYDFWNSLTTYIPPQAQDMADPAVHDEVLAKQLQENQKICENKINEVMEKFVDQQISQNLEPEEVPANIDDEDYKSAEEDGQEESEEEEEQEDPEDIIAISSSSDESDKESTRNPEGRPSYENGDGESSGIEREVKNEEPVEVDKVKKEEVDPEGEDNTMTQAKQEKEREEFGSIASCSFVMKRSKTESSDDDIVEISD